MKNKKIKSAPFINLEFQVVLPKQIPDEIKINSKQLEIIKQQYESEGKFKKFNLIFTYFQNGIQNEDSIKKSNFYQKYATLVEVVSYKEGRSPKLIFTAGKVVKLIDFNKEKNVESLNFSGYSEIFYEAVEEINKVSEETIIEIFKKLEGLIKKHSFLEELNNIIDFVSKQIKTDDKPWELVSIFAEHLNIPYSERVKLLAMEDSGDRLNYLVQYLMVLVNEKKLVENIEIEMKKTLDKQQKEFLLRERIRAIRQQLGEEDEQETKNEKELYKNDDENKFPVEVRQIIKNETRKLKGMMSSSPEANVSKNYLDLIYNLPWRKVMIDDLNIQKAEKELSKKHYGLKDVKERILEFLAVLTNIKEKNKEKNTVLVKELPTENEALDLGLFSKDKNREINNMPILTLVGPPGTGKTTIAQSIADALGRKMIKISLGGVRDESEIRGHRRTYVGAMPGKIINAIKKAGISNPVILLDEIDKMSSDFRGDPASALLEVLDPEQNKFFQDHYLETEYDLSKVIFIATANYFDGIPEALADRMEIIELSSYTLLEKKEIVKSHLLEKVLSENKLDSKYFNIDDETIEFIIQNYTREAGVRDLKRNFDKITRKIIVKLLKGKIAKDQDFVVTKEFVRKMLGVEKFTDDINEKQPQIGAVNGLAYTSYGGSTLSIEVNTAPSTKAEIKLTGQLKDVMRESAEIAISYVRSNAAQFGIDFDFETNQIHIHVPEGAVPKDGPSAGVTFTTAIISALLKKPVSSKIGMTGEITLRGKVLAIGGLKEKSLAAYKFGIKTIFIPKENEKNLQDIAQEVKDNIEFKPVSNYIEIFDYIFKK
ncbi:endopeptidase La [Mesomycoplasma molare]|uniref:Lon protease n=1 Tax=Mesomycoplasma molare TaxID=171288 RepID=A0ABY5TUU5_9BACT|nr:endopeptidase La [Mesomycoplasma molare]UWD34428.1 endopeptidase La [Mesomycoplasma molare]